MLNLWVRELPFLLSRATPIMHVGWWRLPPARGHPVVILDKSLLCSPPVLPSCTGSLSLRERKGPHFVLMARREWSTRLHVIVVLPYGSACNPTLDPRVLRTRETPLVAGAQREFSPLFSFPVPIVVLFRGAGLALSVETHTSYPPRSFFLFHVTCTGEVKSIAAQKAFCGCFPP